MAKSTSTTSVWTYVLIGAFIFVAGVTVLLIAAAIIVPRVIDRTIEKYTDTAPITGQPVELSEREYDSVTQRVESFAEAVDAGKMHEPLVLSSDEVAALIQREVQAELNQTGDPQVQLWLRVEDDRLKGPVSVQTDELAVGILEGLRGRYLNGVATIDVWHANRQIHVRMDDFEIDGDPLPQWVLDGLQDAIDTTVADSQELRDLGRKLDGIELHDGQAIIRAKDFSP